ncbi:hypothetical protein BS50DRAFT_584975 [Corynespora cassiicola Philippines]|uniref:Uncharacterized protein n=1 Tax=Corynespora cassiicola Philippines TaxID=1448308 RepID=A0A2T2P1I2_CORCC|nr:hypothetical protein BS50DRAFT_584975 [Corynespora cassiicola Philippines]
MRSLQYSLGNTMWQRAPHQSPACEFQSRRDNARQPESASHPLGPFLTYDCQRKISRARDSPADVVGNAALAPWSHCPPRCVPAATHPAQPNKALRPTLTPASDQGPVRADEHLRGERLLGLGGLAGGLGRSHAWVRGLGRS